MNNNVERLRALFDTDELYYSVSWTTDSSYKERVLAPLSEENRGGERFIDLVERARGYGADEVIVKAYRKADKKFRKQPEFVEKIRLHSGAAQLQGIELLGGLDGFIRQQVGLETLKAEVDRLREQLNSELEDNKALRTENTALRKENESLRERVKTLEWDIEKMKFHHEQEIEQVKRQSRNLERYVMAGSAAIAKATGLNEQKLKTFLGFIDEDVPQLSGAEEKTEREVSVRVNAVDTAKQPAYEVFNQITTLIERNIHGNSPQDALRYIQSLQAVINYLHTSEANFNSVLDFIRDRYEADSHNQYSEPAEADVYQE